MPRDPRHSSPASDDRWTTDEEALGIVSNTGSMARLDPAEQADGPSRPQKPSVRSSAVERARRRAAREERRSAARVGNLRLVVADPGRPSGDVGDPGRRAAAPSGAPASRRARLAAFATSQRTLSNLCVLLTTVVCVVFAAGAVAPSVGNLYLTVREGERLSSELGQNTERVEWLRDRAAALSTSEGVQDEARRVYGLVTEGEHAVTVVGADAVESYTATAPAEAQSGTGAVSRTWLTDMLDEAFGYVAPSASTDLELATVTEDTLDDAAAE